MDREKARHDDAPDPMTSISIEEEETKRSSAMQHPKSARHGHDDIDPAVYPFETDPLSSVRSDEEDDETKRSPTMQQTQSFFLQELIHRHKSACHGHDDIDPAVYPFEADPLSSVRSEEEDDETKRSTWMQTRPFLLQQQSDRDPILVRKRRNVILFGLVLLGFSIFVVAIAVAVTKNNSKAAQQQSSSSPLPLPPDFLEQLCHDGYRSHLQENADTSSWDACRAECQTSECCFNADGNATENNSTSSCLKGNEHVCSLYYQACIDVLSSTKNNATNSKSTSKPTTEPTTEQTTEPTAEPSQTSTNSFQQAGKPTSENKQSSPNLLFIIADQLRFDVLGHIQARLPEYADKVHVRTPNIDRLAANGVSFETAYCVSPSCGPSRASLRTGNTLQRTGITQNKMFDAEFYERIEFVREKVESLDTFEQLLVENGGSRGSRYTSEYVGKHHAPLIWYYGKEDTEKNVITYNDFDYETNAPFFLPDQQVQPIYQRCIQYLLERDNVDTSFQSGQQLNAFSSFPYDPIRIDARYGMPTHSPLASDGEIGMDSYEDDDVDTCGRDSLGDDYTSTAIVGDIALRSLDRLIPQYKEGNSSFLLYVSFNSPHPPMIATGKYFDYYHDQYSNILVPPSISDDMDNSEYATANQRKTMKKEGSSYMWNNPDLIQELTAVYYAMIEEVDTWVGRLVDKLEANGITDNTMIIFTSDHGEMLGAHGFTGKAVLLEEATRVPLIMSFPNAIAPGTVVSTPVSHMDVFSTVMDYLDAPSYLDTSDGTSLRRFIEQENYNRLFDEEVVVVERDSRLALSDGESFSGQPGDIPNFMIRKGSWKLILTKKRNSNVLDMLYDLDEDPYEMNNLLGRYGMSASNEVVGKAEYLKVLLMEWMERYDTEENYYSDNKYNLGVGDGDLAEIWYRRTWREVAIWQSESNELSFGPPVNRSGFFTRHEYLYIGRTTRGSLRIQDIAVKGPYANYFQIEPTGATVSEGAYVRIRITYYAPWKVDINSLEAYIEFEVSSSRGGLSGTRQIMLVDR